MNRYKLLFAAMLCGLIMTSAAYAQPRGGGRMMGGMQRSPFDTYVAALADANLSPDFTLTPDVKKQIQSVRDDWKKSMDDYRTAAQGRVGQGTAGDGRCDGRSGCHAPPARISRPSWIRAPRPTIPSPRSRRC